MISSPTYSLLVPCFNAEKYISKFEKEISKLTSQFDEIIFYDDGSTDNTLGLLQKTKFKVVDGRVNHGPGYARNRLADLAKGDYIHFHDIDDEFNSDFLSLVKNNIEPTSPDVVIGYADWVDSDSRNTLIKWRYSQFELSKEPLSYLIANPVGIINCTFKKTAFKKINGFNEALKCWEDSDLNIRLAASGASFSVIAEVIAISIRHNNGISRNQQWCWACRLKFLRIYLHEYSKLVNTSVFVQELIKVKNAFINMGQYHLLQEIITLNQQFSLGINVKKLLTLYYINKIIPSSIIKKILSFRHL